MSCYAREGADCEFVGGSCVRCGQLPGRRAGTFSEAFSVPRVSFQDIVAASERLRRDYSDVPVRFEVARDVFEAIASRLGFSNQPTRFPGYSGTPVVVNHGYAPGEWAPVFRCGR